MKVISFDSKVCQNLEEALEKQWIETNCFGGFASSTILSVNTSRRQGLLVARLKPPLGHYLFLNSVEEILYIDEIAYPLSTQIRSGTILPEGYKNLYEFSIAPFPVWIFRVEDLVVAKTLVFIHDEQTVLIRYQILEGDEHLVRLELKPLSAFREIDGLRNRSERLNTGIETSPGCIHLAGLFFYHDAAIVDCSGNWHFRIQYPEEKELGLDFEEDLYAPFRLVYTFQKSREVFLGASLERREALNPAALIDREEERRLDAFKKIHISDPRFQILGATGQLFFANPFGAHKKPLITTHVPSDGTDSVRDVLMSLHGLALTTGDYEVALNVLTYLASKVRQGLLPKRVFHSAEHELKRPSGYDAIDLPLWLIYRTFEYLKYSNDARTVEHVLFPVLRSIVAWYVKGTHFDIRVDSDGLVSGLMEGRPLTWMDAKAGRWAVTAREGKPVEVQALWYNALRAMALMAASFGKPNLRKEYEERAQKAKEAFHDLFWDASLGYLYDVVHRDMKDCSLRPNQLLALGLTFPILEEDVGKGRSILEVTRRHLLTPYGLRTLAPYESNYRGRSDGDPFQRSQAAHQGSVWPWFLVLFLRASLRVDGAVPIEIQSLIEHIETHGLGFISEFFDGNPPHEARGSSADAVSVGSLLEISEILTAEDAPGKPGASGAVPARGFMPRAGGGEAKRSPSLDWRQENS